MEPAPAGDQASFATVSHAACNRAVRHVQVYYRERAAGMYSAVPFGLAQSIVEEPFLIVQTVLYGAITYWMIGFQASAGTAALTLSPDPDTHLIASCTASSS